MPSLRTLTFVLAWAALGLVAGTLLALMGCQPAVIGGAIRVDEDAAAGPAEDADVAVDSGFSRDASASSRDAGLVPARDAAAPPPPVRDSGVPRDSGVVRDAGFADAGFPDSGAVPGPGDGWPTEWATLEEGVLDLVNRQRAQGATCSGRRYAAAGPLTMDAHLRAAARGHSQDMAENNYFDHTSLDGRSPFQRMREAGYDAQALGENIAAGNPTAQATFDQWLNSPGHCSNFMNASANEIGIGYARGPARYRHYWTQTFGRR